MTTAPPIDPTLRGESILLVAPDSRGLLEFTFRNLGAKTITAENVPDAQREIDGHRPDLIISDIALPDAEGFHVRQRRPGVVEPRADAGVVDDLDSVERQIRNDLFADYDVDAEVGVVAGEEPSLERAPDLVVIRWQDRPAAIVAARDVSAVRRRYSRKAGARVVICDQRARRPFTTMPEVA